MTKTVWKFIVPLADEFELRMPSDAQILSFQTQYDSMQIWALVDPASPAVPRRFRLAGTGHPIDVSGIVLRYIGTTQIAGGDLVFHLFEIVGAAS